MAETGDDPSPSLSLEACHAQGRTVTAPVHFTHPVGIEMDAALPHSASTVLLLPLAGAIRTADVQRRKYQMRSYELMVIHRYDMAEPDVRAAVEEVEKAITDRDGVIKDSDFWGKRRFAYNINHMSEGYYSVIIFDGDVDLQNVLDRSLSLLDSVVRHKIVRKSA